MTEEKEKLTSPHVYHAINHVQAALAKEGVSKSRNNQQQGYKFRGIDEIFNALAPHLAEHGLCILPRILSREVTERLTKNGSPLFYVVVDAEYDFVSQVDGSTHTVKVFGEAMDSADKATNKAMSAGYKYACLQAFCIPTEGDNDADATTHEVAPTAPASALRPPAFENPAARITFIDTVSRAFEKAKTTAEVASIRETNLPTLKALVNSPLKEEVDAGARLKREYEEALAMCNANEKSGQKPSQPKTVADALTNDSIPY